MIFAPDHVGDFHLEIVDHIHEMEYPRAIRATDRHVWMGIGITEIEIDLPADKIVDNDVLAWRAEAHRSLILENVAGVLKFLQIALVDAGPFALQIRTEIA